MADEVRTTDNDLGNSLLGELPSNYTPQIGTGKSNLSNIILGFGHFTASETETNQIYGFTEYSLNRAHDVALKIRSAIESQWIQSGISTRSEPVVNPDVKSLTEVNQYLTTERNKRIYSAINSQWIQLRNDSIGEAPFPSTPEYNPFSGIDERNKRLAAINAQWIQIIRDAEIPQVSQFTDYNSHLSLHINNKRFAAVNARWEQRISTFMQPTPGFIKFTDFNKYAATDKIQRIYSALSSQWIQSRVDRIGIAPFPSTPDYNRYINVALDAKKFSAVHAQWIQSRVERIGLVPFPSTPEYDVNTGVILKRKYRSAISAQWIQSRVVTLTTAEFISVLLTASVELIESSVLLQTNAMNAKVLRATVDIPDSTVSNLSATMNAEKLEATASIPMTIFLPQYFTPVNTSDPSIANSITKNALDPVWTELTANMTSGASTLTVANANYFPQTNTFQIVVGHEIMSVTGGAGTTTWTVSRAQRGTTAAAHVRDATVSALAHTIVAGSQDYSLWLQNLTISRITSGGDMEARWTAEVLDPVVLPSHNEAVVISDFYGPYWIGIVDDIEPRYWNGGATVTIVARGYSATLDDLPFTNSQKWPAYTPVHKIFKETRDALCSSIAIDNSLVFGGSRSIKAETGDYWGKTAKQIFNEYAGQGDVNGEPLIYHIHGNDTAVPKLELRTKPLATRYRILLNEVKDSVQFSWKRSSMYSGVLIKWALGIYQKTDPTAVSAIGTKYLIVDATTQIQDIITAQQVAAQILAVRGRVQNIIGPITVQYPNRVLDLFQNQYVPLWRINTGWPIEITDVSTGNIDLPVAEGSIKHVTFNFATRELIIQTEELMTQADVIGQALREEGQKPDSKAHVPDAAATVVKPANVPVSIYSGVSSNNSDNKLGYGSQPDGADIFTVTFNFSGDLAEGHREFAHIHVNARLIASWMITDNPDSDGDSGASVTVGKRDYEGDMTNIIDLYSLSATESEKAEVEFSPDFLHSLTAGQYLVCTLDAFTGTTDNVVVSVKMQKIDGQSENKFNEVAPTFGSVTAVGNNGFTLFTVTSLTDATAQIEFGETVLYGARSYIDDNLRKIHLILVTGDMIGTGFHYRVHLWNDNGLETISSDFIL